VAAPATLGGGPGPPQDRTTRADHVRHTGHRLHTQCRVAASPARDRRVPSGGRDATLAAGTTQPFRSPRVITSSGPRERWGPASGLRGARAAPHFAPTTQASPTVVDYLEHR
jgi:hypothetical protein